MNNFIEFYMRAKYFKSFISGIMMVIMGIVILTSAVFWPNNTDTNIPTATTRFDTDSDSFKACPNPADGYAELKR